MLLPRIYVNTKLKLQQLIELDIEISRRITQVLRLKIAAMIILFNGNGGEFVAKITTINKHSIIAKLEQFIPKNIESPLSIHLGQGIARGEKMDFIIQKAVELGINEITPIFTEHCNVKLQSDRLQNRSDHWQKIAIHAAEQSGRCHVPTVHLAVPIQSWVKQHNDKLGLILDPTAKNCITDLTKPNHQQITLLIGPEGGFSPAELKIAINNNFHPIQLGPRILRTETAALATISVLQALWGGFQRM